MSDLTRSKPESFIQPGEAPRRMVYLDLSPYRHPANKDGVGAKVQKLLSQMGHVVDQIEKEHRGQVWFRGSRASLSLDIECHDEVADSIATMQGVGCVETVTE